MKHFTLQFFFACLLLPGVVLGQVVPNGDFEQWTNGSIDLLDNYETSNSESLIDLGMATLTKSSDSYSGSFAVRIETKTDGSDTTSGYFTLGDIDNGTNGIAYSDIPDTLEGYYKCDVPMNDTAIFGLFFYKNGVPVPTVALKKFYGTQSTYKKFAIATNLSMAPDSVLIGGASSNELDESSPSLPGSWLMLDDIQLTGPSGPYQQIPNNDFENWTPFSYEEPDGWTTMNDFLAPMQIATTSKTSDAHLNSYAVQIEAKDTDQDTIGFITNGSIGYGGTYGGQPYALAVDTLKGHYKYSAGSSKDTGTVALTFKKNGSVIHNEYYQFEPTNSYTYFEIPFNVGSTPDTLRVDLSATQYDVPGSILKVDALQLTSNPVFFSGMNPEETSLQVFPNPANGVVNLSWNGSSTLQQAQAIDLTGKTVRTWNLNSLQGTVRLSADDLPAGLYFLDVQKNDGERIRKRVVLE